VSIFQFQKFKIMNKIETSLLQNMKTNPKKTIQVLINIKEGTDPKSLGLKEYKFLMDEILAASLSAADIRKLSKNKFVVSIEPDEEMGVL